VSCSAASCSRAWPLGIGGHGRPRKGPHRSAPTSPGGTEAAPAHHHPISAPVIGQAGERPPPDGYIAVGRSPELRRARLSPPAIRPSRQLARIKACVPGAALQGQGLGTRRFRPGQ